MESIKQKIYKIIRDDDKNDYKANIFDAIIISLVIINVIIIFLDTFKNIHKYIEPYYIIIDTVSIIVFTIEYVLRIWTSPLMYPDLTPFRARIKYITSAKAIIEFIALFSFYLPLFTYHNLKFIRIIRLFRILSLLKINRYSHALEDLGNVIKRKSLQLLSSIFIVGVLIIFSALLMYHIENDAQPESFNNAYSSLWWTIATLTTVGYGDIYPVTVLGKLLGIFISLLGIALIAIPTGIISAGFMERSREEKSKLREERNYCPYCGKKIRY